MNLASEQAVVLLYVIDAGERAALKAKLEDLNVRVLVIMSADQCVQLAAQHATSLGFIEVRPGDDSGLVVIRELRQASPNADIVVLSAEQDLESRGAAHHVGANDYLSTPVRNIDLRMRLQCCLSRLTSEVQISFGAVPTPEPRADTTPEPRADTTEDLRALKAVLAQTRAALSNALRAAPVSAPSISGEKEASDVDALTGLPGPGPLQDYLDREYGRARRYGHALSVLLIDVDKMARYSQQHGSAAGDKALCLIADVLRSALRSPDIVTRLGSDAFAVLATDTNEDQALQLGNRLRAALAKESLHASSPPVTISIGIASAQRLSVACASDLLSAAERAMTEAKSAGRDRCCIAIEA